MHDVYLWEEGDLVKVRHIYNADDIYEENALARKDGRGFTRGRHGFVGNMRRVASIPIDDLERLAANGDMDAVVAIAESGENAQKALRRLILKHPEWRCSEGAI